MRKIEYDFLAWTSFPSSIKAINDEKAGETIIPYATVPVKAGSMVRAEVKVKQKNVTYSNGNIPIIGVRADETGDWIGGITLPLGDLDWSTFVAEVKRPMPEEYITIQVRARGGAGSPKTPGVTWFDDLRIYQDDVLIYSDDFSKWDPVIGSGIGAPIGGAIGYFLKEPLGPMVSEVVGAVLGGALGGGVGLLTGLGIIPQISIPALGAAMEGPRALARLGKYQITG